MLNKYFDAFDTTDDKLQRTLKLRDGQDVTIFVSIFLDNINIFYNIRATAPNITNLLKLLNNISQEFHYATNNLYTPNLNNSRDVVDTLPTVEFNIFSPKPKNSDFNLKRKKLYINLQI
jgi:dihydroorotate dehydrogenase